MKNEHFGVKVWYLVLGGHEHDPGLGDILGELPVLLDPSKVQGLRFHPNNHTPSNRTNRIIIELQGRLVKGDGSWRKLQKG